MTWSKGLPPGMVAAVLTCIEEVRQAPVNPARTGTDAKTILGLWRATGKPEPEVFAAELRTVIKWARESNDKLAAYDIRAVGWNAGTDRHRDLATICRHERWGLRLSAAKEWAEPSPSPAVASAAPDIMDNYRRLVGILCQRDDRRLIEGDNERHTLALRYAVKLCGGRDAFRADPDAFLDRWPEVWAAAEAEVTAKLAAMSQP